MTKTYEIPLDLLVGAISFFCITMISYGTISRSPLITGFQAVSQQQAQAVLTVNTYIYTSLNRTPINFTFEGIVPGYWYNASNGTDGNGWPTTLIMWWETNVNTNISFWGNPSFCKEGTACAEVLSERFDIGNLTFNTTDLNFTIPGNLWHHYAWGKFNTPVPITPTKILTNKDVVYNTTCPCGERNYTIPMWFSLFVPPGTRAGNWNTTVYWRVDEI